MIELDKDNFDQVVLAHKGTFLVDFWSESCEACQAMMPELEALERDLEGELGGAVACGRVNLQGNRRLAIREKVLGLPTVVIYRDGAPVRSFAREFTASEVKAAVRELASG
jgi:thioredoxin 1